MGGPGGRPEPSAPDQDGEVGGDRGRVGLQVPEALVHLRDVAGAGQAPAEGDLGGGPVVLWTSEEQK